MYVSAFKWIILVFMGVQIVESLLLLSYLTLTSNPIFTFLSFLHLALSTVPWSVHSFHPPLYYCRGPFCLITSYDHTHHPIGQKEEKKKPMNPKQLITPYEWFDTFMFCSFVLSFHLVRVDYSRCACASLILTGRRIKIVFRLILWTIYLSHWHDPNVFMCSMHMSVCVTMP